MESHIRSCNYEPAHTLQVCNFQTLVVICTADYIYDLANLFMSQTGRNSKLTHLLQDSLSMQFSSPCAGMV